MISLSYSALSLLFFDGIMIVFIPAFSAYSRPFAFGLLENTTTIWQFFKTPFSIFLRKIMV